MSPPPQSPLRLAILECDQPIGRTREKYGRYGTLFTQLLHAGAREFAARNPSAAPPPHLAITTYDVVTPPHAYPALEDVDAVLLTGSRHNAFDDDPWILRLLDFTRRVLAQRRVRALGVCFGHQLVGRALGAPVERCARGWEVSVVEVALTEAGKRVFPGREILPIHQMHRDVVAACPPELERLGFTRRCEVQGMYARRRVMTVQGHPEFDGEIVSELLENRHQSGVFDDAVYEDGMARVGKADAGVDVAVAFMGFLLDE